MVETGEGAIRGNHSPLGKGLSEFEQGRHPAYREMMDIIKTRHAMILELIADEE